MFDLSTSKNLEKILTGLLGREVLASRKPVPAAQLKITGTYQSDAAEVVTACLADLPFAILSGAALSLIPPGPAKDLAKTARLDEELRDNFAEVLNVLSRLFTDELGRRMVLRDVYFPPDKAPPAVAGAIAKAKKRLDVELTINGYGRGRMSLVAL